MKSDSSTGKSKKSAIEQQALINEIIKRDDKFYSLNQDFHLDLKSCKKKYNNKLYLKYSKNNSTKTKLCK
jgi:hypothetical protein